MKKFDEELAALTGRLTEMGRTAQSMITAALKALGGTHAWWHSSKISQPRSAGAYHPTRRPRIRQRHRHPKHESNAVLPVRGP